LGGGLVHWLDDACPSDSVRSWRRRAPGVAGVLCRPVFDPRHAAREFWRGRDCGWGPAAAGEAIWGPRRGLQRAPILARPRAAVRHRLASIGTHHAADLTNRFRDGRWIYR